MKNESASENITITIPTLLSEKKWNDLLEGEDRVRRPIGYRTVPDERYNLLVLTLKPGNYRLRIAKVGVGEGVTRRTGEYYVTTTDQQDQTIEPGDTVDLSVEVRDRYNNPVSGEQVTISATGGSVDPRQVTTKGDGKATFTYTAPKSEGTYTVTATIDGGGNETEKVTFTLTVEAESNAGGNGTAGAGQGGTSTYSTTDSTETISVENGLWTDITKTDQIILSNSETVLDDYDDDGTTEEYVYLEFTVENASSRYRIEVFAVRDVDGSNEGGYVGIYSVQDDTERFEILTPEAVNAILDSSRRYNGVDVLNRANFANPSSGFIDYLRQVAAMDASKTELQIQSVSGRVDTTLRGEALFEAVEPDPSTSNDRTEFVAVYFENETDIGGWNVSDSDDSDTLPSKQDFRGKLYLTKNETAFLNAHPNVSSSRVVETSLRLSDGGEALELRDPDGRLRDEVAYGGETTSHGWSLTIGTDEVGYRTAYSDGVYKDTDSKSDWGVESESAYFGAGGGSVTYNGDALATRGKGSDAILSNVTFSVTNQRSSDVRIVEITVDPANGDIARLSDPSTGEGKYESEFHVVVSGTTYTADFGGGKGLPATFDLSEAGNANDEPVIGASETATFYLTQFLDSNGNEFDVVCEKIEITLTYSDGTSTTFTVRPEDGVGGKCGASGTPGPGLVYRAAKDNDLRSIDGDGLINDFDINKPTRTGPMTANLDSDGMTEVPYIGQNDDLKIVDLGGEVQTLVDSGITSTRLAVGTWDGETSVFYVNGNGKLTRVRAGQSPQVIYKKPNNQGNKKPVAATAVAGVADMNGDGSAELVFVNDNQEITYLVASSKANQKWKEVETGVVVNTASAVGAPADVDGDGTPEVPYISGNGKIRLVDRNGHDGTLTTGVGKEYPVATFDWTGDGQEDVIYIGLGPDGNNYYLKYVTGNGTVGYVRDSNGDKVQVKAKSTGVSSVGSPTVTGFARMDATASDRDGTRTRVASTRASPDSSAGSVRTVPTSPGTTAPPARAGRPGSLAGGTSLSSGKVNHSVSSGFEPVHPPIASSPRISTRPVEGWRPPTCPVQNSHTRSNERPDSVGPVARFFAGSSERRQPAPRIPR